MANPFEISNIGDDSGPIDLNYAPEVKEKKSRRECLWHKLCVCSDPCVKGEGYLTVRGGSSEKTRNRSKIHCRSYYQKR